MGEQQRSFSRAARVGVFLASLVLALSMAGIAFANTASFSGMAPVPGSSSTVSKPSIAVTVYDKYGIVGSSNYSMFIDGARVTPAIISWFKGYGYTKFRLGYQVSSALPVGTHTVMVNTRDQARGRSSFSWSFTVVVADTTPPTTTSGALPKYPELSAIQLSATDNAGGSGVAHTYYRIDGGAQTEGTTVLGTFAIGPHTLEFWSVDKAGNAEFHHTVSFTIVDFHALPTLAPAASCVASGCHAASDIASIHLATGGPGCPACHAGGRTPSSDCTTCHAAHPGGGGGAHQTVASNGTPSCTQSTCHGTNNVTTFHPTCATCHSSSDPKVKAAIMAGIDGTPAHCEDCHDSGYAAIHTNGTTGHTLSASWCGSAAGCHNSTDVSLIHTTGDDPPGCLVCHGVGVTPSTTCANCHPNITTIHGHVHANASGTKSTACTACHGTDLPTAHNGVYTGQASLGCFCHTTSYLRGEMTPLLAAGKSECVDCHKGQYAAHGFASSSAAPSASGHNTTTYGTVGAYEKWDGSEGGVVKDSTGATITQEWPLPTADVFWSQVDYTKSSNTTDNPDFIFGNGTPGSGSSKIKQVGWNSVVTCQDCHTGLNAAGPHGESDNWGIDPNFPDPWTNAEITSFDPTGMRSVATTAGSTNRFYTKQGSLVNANGSFGTTTTTSSSGYSAGDVEGRFICQKCHKLVNPYQGLAIAGNGRGFRSNNFNYVGFSNEVHMGHHGDMITGAANCVSCHIAIPHGWVRPRLLVYSTDPAPYVGAQPSNWALGTSSAYGTSEHLDGINAAPTADKETTMGVAGDYRSADATAGTSWGNWSTSKLGTGWEADPNALPPSNAVQNNCNACSASGSTHTPASEGYITTQTPSWP